MSDAPVRLTLKLEGPLVEEHRLPLSELQRIARHLRGTLRGIAMVLTDYGPSGHGGRVKKFIEESVDLRVVGSPRKGSFTLEMELPPDAPPEQAALLQSVGPRLGERSVLAFINGLEALSDETEKLPVGYDRGVLQAIEGFRQTLRRGVSDIVLSTSDAADALPVRWTARGWMLQSASSNARIGRTRSLKVLYAWLTMARSNAVWRRPGLRA
jgi:hypothetical protein